ncbi:hypothetical protein ACQCLI_15705 [Pseudomonas nitroreducens]|uniref:hypothetical protein n=1 Tax=Pseudomonas TaxID=286 RepID=UPI0002E77647|nr:hypothetical protein [Pseudomonas nitroreducens]
MPAYSTLKPEAERTVLIVAVKGQPQLLRHYRLRDLEALLVGFERADTQHLRVEALNDYSTLIPLGDLDAFEPILAYRRDGHSIGIAERGPLFVIYPMVDHPELRTQVYFNRTVWQVSRITLE